MATYDFPQQTHGRMWDDILGGREFVLAGDFNAHSPVWYSL